MRSLKKIFVLMTVLAAGACYRYVPTEPAAIPPGSNIKAVLTGDGIEAMRPVFGPDVTSVAGPFLYTGGQGVKVLTEVTVRREGFPPTTMNDTVRLEPHHVARLELRELDGLKTAGFTLGAAAAMAGALLAGKSLGGSSEDGEGGGPDPEAFILFKIPLKIGGG